MSEPRVELEISPAERELLRRLARASLEALERSRQRIDGLNVYPVPDGDTGMNLLLTVRALVDELEEAPYGRPLLRRDLARALLMGARGNSGVILSQIVRGAVEAAPAGQPFDARALAMVLERARDAAYGAVHRPVEGTMLTLTRALADVSRARRHRKPPLEALLRALIEHGEEVLARTPEQLPVLGESTVVDAGAAGLLECLRAIAAELSGERRTAIRPELRLVTVSSDGI